MGGGFYSLEGIPFQTDNLQKLDMGCTHTQRKNSFIFSLLWAQVMFNLACSIMLEVPAWVQTTIFWVIYGLKDCLDDLQIEYLLITHIKKSGFCSIICDRVNNFLLHFILAQTSA
jgi:hypothetical protein